MRRAAAAAVAALALLAAASCSRPAAWQRDAGEAWGTVYHITYRSDVPLHDSIRAVMRAVELSVSPYEPQSRISAINAGRTDTLDALLRALVEESRRVCDVSGGAFDPTVMPLVDLWGFGPAGRGTEPDSAAIDSALATVGIAGCTVRPDGTVALKHPCTRLDFSAIAKGAGVDAVAAMLRRNGATDYLVEIGGEVAVLGSNPKGLPWHIQIDAPVDDPDGVRHESMRVIAPDSAAAVATSGNYRNYRLLADGSRAGHIISPRTGRPVATPVISATVVAPTCMLADALATAAMGMQPDSALLMASRLPGVAMLLAVAEADTVQTVETRNFPSTRK